MGDAPARGHVRVALVDSGVDPAHPGLRGKTLRGEPDALRDRLGHGTWMAAAILALAPEAELVAIAVLLDGDRCDPAELLRGIDAALATSPDFVNVSFGVTDLALRDAFAAGIARAQACGARIVAPASLQGLPCWPGALSGADGVVVDPNLARALPQRRRRGDRELWFASGVAPSFGALPAPRARGESFAAANVTGHLASRARG
ncbi:MAG: hypothetical protein HZB39_01805 [Planctomycetes bacterium]|nr:hypothetical protein [Planctomycetota bacterium]